MVFLVLPMLFLSETIIKSLFSYVFVRYFVLCALTLNGLILLFGNRDMIEIIFSYREKEMFNDYRNHWGIFARKQ